MNLLAILMYFDYATGRKIESSMVSSMSADAEHRGLFSALRTTVATRSYAGFTHGTKSFCEDGAALSTSTGEVISVTTGTTINRLTFPQKDYPDKITA